MTKRKCNYSFNPIDKCGKPAVTGIFNRVTGALLAQRCAEHTAKNVTLTDTLFEQRPLTTEEK